MAIALVCAPDAMAGMAIAVTWFGLRLQRVPDRMLGRVVALTRTVAFAAVPVHPNALGEAHVAAQTIATLGLG